MQSCELNPIASLLDPSFEGQAGTVFHAPAIDILRRGGRASNEDMGVCAIILMSGIAEALAFGSAEGGAADERALRNLFQAEHAEEALASVWTKEMDVKVRSKARWAVANAVTLLREHCIEFAALLNALDQGLSIGSCVQVIELSRAEASRDDFCT